MRHLSMPAVHRSTRFGGDEVNARDQRVIQLSKMTKRQLKAEQAKYVRVLMGNGSKDEIIHDILVHEGLA